MPSASLWTLSDDVGSARRGLWNPRRLLGCVYGTRVPVEEGGAKQHRRQESQGEEVVMMGGTRGGVQ